MRLRASSSTLNTLFCKASLLWFPSIIPKSDMLFRVKEGFCIQSLAETSCMLSAELGLNGLGLWVLGGVGQKNQFGAR